MLFASYTQELAKAGHPTKFELSDPLVISGLFLGGILPFLFGAIPEGCGIGFTRGRELMNFASAAISREPRAD